MAEQDTFVYLIRPARPGFAEGMTADEERVMEAHFAYLQRGLEEKRLLLAGPCLDAAFGIVLFRASSLDEAEAFMRADPAVVGDVMHAEVHPFRVSLKA
jgi:uncharacterized protein